MLTKEWNPLEPKVLEYKLYARGVGTVLALTVRAAATARSCSASHRGRLPGAMPCLVVLLALISPRLALFAMWLFSDILGDAYDSWIVPLLGFFVLPWTTLAYAGMWSSGTNVVHGFEWFIVGFAFVVDIGSYAGGRSSRAERA